jgi:hypothetical protein
MLLGDFLHRNGQGGCAQGLYQRWMLGIDCADAIKLIDFLSC